MAVTVNAAIIDEKDTVVVAIEKINAGDEIIWRYRNGSSKIWRTHWSCSM